MCFNWKNIEEGRSREELSIEEIKRIAEGFKGLHSLIVSGGEPFLREDLEEVVTEFHNRSGTRHVSIPTNLFCEEVPEKIRNLAVKHPGVFFRILMSIDGIGEDHDFIRDRNGGFDKLLCNYERLRAYKKGLSNVSLNAAVVLSTYNKEKIGPLLDFVGGLDIDDIKLIYVRGDTREPEAKDVPPVVYQKAFKLAESLTIKRNRTKSFYNNLLSAVSLVSKELIAEGLVKNRMPVPCNAGTRFLVVSDTGEVFPCEMLGRDLGNLREHDYDISSVLKSTKAKDVLEFIRQGKCFCTMDCNTISNVIYSPSLYPRVFKKLRAIYLRGKAKVK
jgi:MoaA/NifB/PqqE/SkfB family radical SAM enzyme